MQARWWVAIGVGLACLLVGCRPALDPEVVDSLALTATPFQPIPPTAALADSTLQSAATPDPEHTLFQELTLALARLPFRYRRSELEPSAVQMLYELNRARAAAGRPPLEAHEGLMDLAFLRARDLVARDYMAHRDPETGVDLAWTLLTAAGYYGRLGENLFAATGPLESLPPIALQAWLDSPEHRANLLDPAFRLAGVGLMGDGTWWKVVVLFAEHGP